MIQSNEFVHKKFNFPAGEVHVNVDMLHNDVENVSIKYIYDTPDSIMELLLVCNALKNMHKKLKSLHIGYFPYSRQDRVTGYGDPFSLKVMADLINSLEFESVRIVDPHSDVLPALINNCIVIHQHTIAKIFLNNMKDFYLVSPDGGALKKIYKLAKEVDCCGVIECSKHRNVKTGEITSTNVYCDDIHGKKCVVVDDICDGGRTFIEIAKVLKTKNCGGITLFVTHGLFTKGLDELKKYYNDIITSNGFLTDHTEDMY